MSIYNVCERGWEEEEREIGGREKRESMESHRMMSRNALESAISWL